MIVLGVNHSHNAAVSLSVDGELIFHIESERINNIRYGWFAFPAIAQIKNHVSYIDHLVISGTHPVINKIDELCQMDAYSAFIKSLGKSFNDHEFVMSDFSSEHHLTHAISAHYGSGFDTSLCIVKDGSGSIVQTDFGPAAEVTTTMVIDKENFYIVDKRLSAYKKLSKTEVIDSHTTVSPYSSEADAFTIVSQALGFGVWDAGKVMGVSSYGKDGDYSFFDEDGVTNEIIPQIKSSKIDSFQSGANLAHAIQSGTEKHVISYILRMIEETGITDVTLSGGLFQNCVMNYKILKALPTGSRLYVEPLSNDAGTSIGAVDLIYRERDATYSNKRGSLYLGGFPEYKDIDNAVSATPRDVAKLISEKKIVAIFQGRSESGTRALGNRSILYDPRDPDGKDRVNVVKKREWFRPFAGSVLHEKASEWFNLDKLEESPYMLYAVDVLKDKQKDIPCITHVNETCRIQTVKESQNKNFYELISAFYDLTNVPILLNTSLNLAGDAIVETVSDALDTFYNSDIDVLYLPDIGKMIKKV